MLGMPLSKQVGGGLRELRFTCEGVARRITYVLEPERRAITLTTFRKQRQNERGEISGCRIALTRSPLISAASSIEYPSDLQPIFSQTAFPSLR